MSHPSLLSPYDEAFLTLTSTTSLRVLTCPKSAGHARLRTSAVEFGYMAKSGLHTVQALGDVNIDYHDALEKNLS